MGYKIGFRTIDIKSKIEAIKELEEFPNKDLIVDCLESILETFIQVDSELVSLENDKADKQYSGY